VINAGRPQQFHGSCDEPSPFVYIEFHHAFVPHFQQKGLASLFIRHIGALHDLVHFERLFAERIQNIFSIIQHDQSPAVIKRAGSLRIGKLIFRHHSLDILRLTLDPISNTSICLDGHMLNDRVNHRGISCSTTLGSLGLVADVVIQLVGMWHVSSSKIHGCISVDHAVLQRAPLPFGRSLLNARPALRWRDRPLTGASYECVSKIDLMRSECPLGWSIAFLYGQGTTQAFGEAETRRP
jgi:hypothetical protein